MWFEATPRFRGGRGWGGKQYASTWSNHRQGAVVLVGDSDRAEAVARSSVGRGGKTLWYNGSRLVASFRYLGEAKLQIMESKTLKIEGAKFSFWKACMGHFHHWSKTNSFIFQSFIKHVPFALEDWFFFPYVERRTVRKSQTIRPDIF